jgi:putative ABC transport system permease protein
MLSLRNAFRHKVRLALTLFALSLAGAIFIGVFGTRDSMLALLQDTFVLLDYDVEVYFNGSVHPRMIRAIAADVPGVVGVESWLYLRGTHIRPDDGLGVSFSLLGAPVDQQTTKPVLVRGRWLQPGDERALVVTTEVLRQIPSLDVGDELSLEIAGRRSSWRIVGVVLALGDRGYVNDFALAKASGMMGLANRAAFVLEERDDPLVQRVAAKALTARYEQAGMEVDVVQTSTDARATSLVTLDVVIYTLMAMVALSAVVGGLGLAATMGLNVLERTREIGVLRAIGATDWCLGAIIVLEGVVIGLLSWGLGTGLALPIGRLLSAGVGWVFFGVRIEHAFSSIGVVFWLALVVVLSGVSSLAPAYRASRISVREALAYE